MRTNFRESAVAADIRKYEKDHTCAYYLRGCANFIKRDWAKALSDFQHHCELRKEEKYQVFEARFYIWLIRARLGDREAADKELAPYNGRASSRVERRLARENRQLSAR